METSYESVDIMTTIHYRIGTDYVGGFGDGAIPPSGAVICPAPNRGDNVWNGSSWEPKTLTQSELDEIKQIVADQVIEVIGPIRALALTMLSEINILRAAAGLSPRTVQQLKDAVFDNSD